MALPVKDEVELIVSDAQQKVAARWNQSSKMIDDIYRLLVDVLGRMQNSLEDIKTRDVNIEIDDPGHPPTFSDLKDSIPDMGSIETMIERFLSEIENLTPPGNVTLKDISTSQLDTIISQDPTGNRPNITYRPVDPTPTVNPPPFTGDIAPSNLSFAYPIFNYTETPYTSALKTRIESYVLNVLNNGGTGVNSAVEDALFNRDTERAVQAKEDAKNAALVEWSKRGAQMPDDDIIDAIARIDIEYLNKRLDVSRDILIKAWELEQANIFKSLDKAVEFESQMITLANNIAQRAFDTLKAVADIAFKVIDSEIKKVELSIEEKKMQLTLWEGRVKSELVKLEVYKAYLEGRKIEAEVDQINLELYKTDISAWQSRIDAAKAIIAAIVAYNDGLLKQQSSLADIYKTMSGVSVSKADIGIKGIAAESEVFKSIASAYETLGNLAVKEYDANIQQGIAEAQLQLKNIEVEIANYEKLTALVVTTLNNTAQLLAQALAGAAAGTSAQVQLSADGRASESYEYQVKHTET